MNIFTPHAVPVTAKLKLMYHLKPSLKQEVEEHQDARKVL